MIPPNKPCVREDEADRLYDTVENKEKAIVDEIASTHATGPADPDRHAATWPSPSGSRRCSPRPTCSAWC